MMQDNYITLTMEGGTLFVRGNQFEESPISLSDPGKPFPVRSFLLSFTCLSYISWALLSEVSPSSVSCCTFQTEDWMDLQLFIAATGLVRVSVGNNADPENKPVLESGNKPVYNIKDFKELYVGGAPRELRETYVFINILMTVR